MKMIALSNRKLLKNKLYLSFSTVFGTARTFTKDFVMTFLMHSAVTS